MPTLALLQKLTQTMRERDIEALEADVRIPHPYPELSYAFARYHFHLDQRGRMLIDGQEITDPRAKLSYLEDATTYRTNRTLIHRNGVREKKAA